MLIVEALLFAYCIYFVSYALIFAIGGFFYKKKSYQETKEYKKFAVLIPGYKEDSIICNSVRNNLLVDYPTDKFELVVIADSFQKSTIDQLKKLPVNVMEVSFEKSTKVKSLKESLIRLESKFDYLVILDADNVMEKDYLKKVNEQMIATHYKALQTQRSPKNKNTTLAVLDGISEAINNHIYRQGSHALGLSVSLNGSGMVFEKEMFEQIISQMESVGGFDRELEYRYLENNHSVKYFREAEVFDEKIDNHDNFKNQRKRWISSQYVYLRRYFLKGVQGLLKGDLAYFNSTVWRNIQLPRLINIGLITIFTFFSVILSSYLNIPFYYWIALWVLNTFAMFISIPRKFYNKDLVMSLVLLPKIFLSMFLLMFKLKGANKKFIHTEHKTVS